MVANTVVLHWESLLAGEMGGGISNDDKAGKMVTGWTIWGRNDGKVIQKRDMRG